MSCDRLPNGYSNVGANLCFLNTGLQCLWSCPDALCRMAQHAQTCPMSLDRCHTCFLFNVMHRQPSSPAIGDVSPLVQCLGERFQFLHCMNEQEDLAQFLEAVLGGLDAVVQSRFRVQSEVKLTCANGHVSSSTDSQLLWQVPVLGHGSLQSMLDSSMASETLQDRRCSDCGMLGPTTTMRKVSITKAPMYLLLHQKRFTFDVASQQPRKLFNGCTIEREVHVDHAQLRRRDVYEVVGIANHSGGHVPDSGHYMFRRLQGPGLDAALRFSDVDIMPMGDWTTTLDSQPYVVVTRFKCSLPLYDSPPTPCRSSVLASKSQRLPPAIVTQPSMSERARQRYAENVASGLGDDVVRMQVGTNLPKPAPTPHDNHWEQGTLRSHGSDSPLTITPQQPPVATVAHPSITESGRDNDIVQEQVGGDLQNTAPTPHRHRQARRLWNADNELHQQYVTTLHTQQWLSTQDVFIGRMETRRAQHLRRPLHLPIEHLMPVSEEHVVHTLAGVHGGAAAVSCALQCMRMRVASPILVFGDNTHWRCIAMCQHRHTVYCIDPLGRASFPASVLRCILQLCDREFASGAAPSVEVNEPVYQVDSHSCGPLAILVGEIWEAYVEVGNTEVGFLSHLHTKMSALQEACASRHVQFNARLRSRLLQRAEAFRGQCPTVADVRAAALCLDSADTWFPADTTPACQSPGHSHTSEQCMKEESAEVETMHGATEPGMHDSTMCDVDANSNGATEGTRTHKTVKRANWTLDKVQCLQRLRVSVMAASPHMKRCDVVTQILCMAGDGPLKGMSSKQIRNKFDNLKRTDKKRAAPHTTSNISAEKRPRPPRSAKPSMSAAQAAADFAVLKDMAPVQQCSSCERLWFRKQVKPLAVDILQRLRTGDDTSGIYSAFQWVNDDDVKLQFCNTCHSTLSQGEVPRHHRLVGIRFPELQQFVSQLNDIEARLVALSLPFGAFVSLRGAQYKQISYHGIGQRGLRGTIANVPTDTTVVQRTLPRTTMESQTIFVSITRAPNAPFNRACWQGNVDQAKVMSALRELAETELYKSYNVVVLEHWQVQPEGADARESPNVADACDGSRRNDTPDSSSDDSDSDFRVPTHTAVIEHQTQTHYVHRCSPCRPV